MINDIESPIHRFAAFIEERENIRIRKESGKPWPWTQEPVLQQYRFTNINRENDKVSKHYQKTVRNRYGEEDVVFPATVLYRWFNRPETCEFLFNQPDFNYHSTFERYMVHGSLEILLNCLRHIPPPHITGAYIITGKPGHPKGEGILRYFDTWCKKPWKDRWHEWYTADDPPSLQGVSDWMQSEGLGGFMRAQLVADLKYLPFLKHAPDWWTFAEPGPGSKRGMNVVLGRDMYAEWNVCDWQQQLNILNDAVTPLLEEAGIDKLHNQDLQNCLCEYYKFTKTSRGEGRPRQRFHHV